MSDTALIIALTVGCCLGVGLLGLFALRRMRRMSLRWQFLVAALLPVLAVAASVLANVRLMFLSAHDSSVVALALAASLPLGLGAGWLVLRRVVLGSAVIGSTVTGLVADSTGTTPTAPPAPSAQAELPAELAHLHGELDEARRTLAAFRDRERRAEDARRELVSFLSHDLRTPLAGMRALTEALEDGLIADVPRALAQLRAMETRMSGLVEDLFELSRVQAEDRPGVRTPVSVAELVADVADELDPTASAAGVRLVAAVPATDRLAVSGDADALGRALANLVSNAVRHTDAGGTVRVTADRGTDGHLRVSVTDGCGGIPAEHLDRVFDTGWRGSSARTQTADDARGAGLGLAITKGVVTAHDGSIAVRNVAGGCRFDLDLPALAPLGGAA